MTEPQDYTLEQFLSEIEAIIKANPNAVNPVGVNGCVYETADGHRHCVIGKWLKGLGLIDLLIGLDPDGNRCGFGYNEDDGNESAEDILPKMGFSEPVAAAAERIQFFADTKRGWTLVSRNGLWANILLAPELKDLFS